MEKKNNSRFEKKQLRDEQLGIAAESPSRIVYAAVISSAAG
jgi:hypothetical protein